MTRSARTNRPRPLPLPIAGRRVRAGLRRGGEGTSARPGAPGGQGVPIRLTERLLYRAADGNPIDGSGIEELMFSHMSSRRDTRATGGFGI